MRLDDVLFASGRQAEMGRLEGRAGRWRFVPGGSAEPRWLVLPGLVNGHDHLQLNCFPRLRFRRRYGHAVDWARDMAARMGAPEIAGPRALTVADRSLHGAFKNAVAGAVVVANHDPAAPELLTGEYPIRVVTGGWAHSVPLADADWRDDRGPAPRYGPELAASVAASEPGRPYFIHMAEGTDARAAAELPRLAELGGLGADTRLVHGVGMHDGLAAARQAGAALVWCPSANHFLLGATAPVGAFRPGAWLLGSDSRLCGGRDLLDEISLAAVCPALSAADVVDALTAGGRRLLGAPEIDPERLEDLVVLPAAGRRAALPGGSAAGPEFAVARLAAARRGDLSLVACRRRVLVADSTLAGLAGGEPLRPARIDGRAKLIAPALIAGWWEAGLREGGLDLDGVGERAA